MLAPHLVPLPTSKGKASICLTEKKDYVRGWEVAVADVLYKGGGGGNILVTPQKERVVFTCFCSVLPLCLHADETVT